MENLSLQKKDKQTFIELSRKTFKKMTDAEKQQFIKLGAKDFSNRFGSTIKRLANE